MISLPKYWTIYFTVAYHMLRLSLFRKEKRKNLFYKKYLFVLQGLFPPGQGATIGVDFMIKTVEVENEKVKVCMYM